MKNIFLPLLFVSTNAYSSLPSGVTQEAVDVMIREETGLSQDRFKGKLYCNFEKPKHCLPEGMKEKSWIDANNRLTNGLCIPEFGGRPSSWGIKDQWQCLTMWQQIREDSWQERHEEFFQKYKYLSRDYFERWESKYPKAILNPAYIHSAIEDGYLLNLKCDLLDYDCLAHLGASHDIYVKWIKERYCAYKGMKSSSDVGARVFQSDEEAGKQCFDFAMELIKLGHVKIAAEAPAPALPYLNTIKANYNTRIKDIDTLKRLFAGLKDLLSQSEWKMSNETYHLPTHLALRSAVIKLQKLLKAADPSLDVTVTGMDYQGKALDKSLLPMKDIQKRVGQIGAPKVTIGGVRTSARVIDEVVVVKGDYYVPGVSLVEIPQTDGTVRREHIFHQFKDGKVLLLEPGILIEQTQGQVQVVATGPEKDDGPQDVYDNLKDFQTNIKLDVRLPEAMNFSTLDIDDDIAAIYGRQASGAEMAVLAARETGTSEDVISFLNSYKEALPMLKGQGFNPTGEIEDVDVPSGSGLKKVTLIPGQERDGSRIWAAHVDRTDGTGSYLFIMKATTEYFEKNDAIFEAMLKSMKVK